jgi:hyperosmotically inducible periplasmic protein
MMKKRTLGIGAVFAGLFLLAASNACRPNQTVERQADDASIKTSIKAKLASDVRFSTLTSVSVDVTNGVVTLAGPVHTDEEKQKVEEVARGVKGVTQVMNNLQVQPEPAAGTGAAAGSETTSAGSTTTTVSAGASSAALTPPWSATTPGATTPAAAPAAPSPAPKQ